MRQEPAASVLARCDELAQLSEASGGLTRRSYTPAMRQAHARVRVWMRAAGMAVREDAACNLIGRYEAATPDAPALLIGSHLDSVADAGRYDGPLGVLIGLAVVERLHAAGRRMPFAVEVAAFADEEGLRFGASFLGSAAVAGCFDRALLDLCDADAITLAEAMRGFGGDPDRLSEAARAPGELLAYLEVHIEQGPLLEARQQPLGVVTAIQGATRASITLSGTAGHAGTTPMELRRDALCAAAELVLAIEARARSTPGLVATVGQLAVHPGAANVIPGEATFSLDLRHPDDGVRLAAREALRAELPGLAAVRGVGLSWKELQSTAAVPMAAALRKRLLSAVAASGYMPVELPSGAGHDAMILARVTDAAMLFVRCKGGISHNPAEAVEQADVAAAIAVVERLLDDLAAW
jgi:allantoate deiminase